MQKVQMGAPAQGTAQAQVRKNYNAIDIMRMVCAVLVMCVHVYPLTMFGQKANFVLVHAVARLAVPFFCTASGFFFFQKITLRPKTPQEKQENRHALFVFVRRVLALYVIWSAAYLPVRIALAKINHQVFSWAAYWKEALYYTTYLHLWYFPALILGIVLTYALLRCVHPAVVLALSGALYGIGLFGDSYYGLLQSHPYLTLWTDKYLKIFHTTRNGLFFAFFFVALGAWFAKREIKMKKWISGPLALISVGLLVFEACLLEQKKIAAEYNLYLSLIPVTVFLFAFLKEVTLKDRPCYRMFREMSVLIYCSHELVRRGLEVWFYYHPQLQSWYKIYNVSLVRFAVVLFGALLISALILFLQKKCRLRFLKWLY